MKKRKTEITIVDYTEMLATSGKWEDPSLLEDFQFRLSFSLKCQSRLCMPY